MNNNHTPSVGKFRQGHPGKYSSTANLHSKGLLLNKSSSIYSFYETIVSIDSFHFLNTIKKSGIITIRIGDKKYDVPFTGHIAKGVSGEFKFQDYEAPHKIETNVCYYNSHSKQVLLGTNIHIFIKNKSCYTERLIIFDKGEIKGFVYMKFQFKAPKFSPPKIFNNHSSFSKYIKKFFINSEKVMEKRSLTGQQSKNIPPIEKISIENFLEEPHKAGSNRKSSRQHKSRPSIGSSKVDYKFLLFKNLSVTENDIAEIHSKGSIHKPQEFNAEQASLDNLKPRPADYLRITKVLEGSPDKAMLNLKHEANIFVSLRKNLKARALNLKIAKLIETRSLEKKKKKLAKTERRAEELDLLLKNFADRLYNQKFIEVSKEPNWKSLIEIASPDSHESVSRKATMTLASIASLKEDIADLEFEQKELLRIKERLRSKLHFFASAKPRNKESPV